MKELVENHEHLIPGGIISFIFPDYLLYSFYNIKKVKLVKLLVDTNMHKIPECF